MICGVIKRWILNKKAKELGATKLATGHNLDDEAQTLLMNLFKGNPGLSLNLGPKTGVIENQGFVQRVKPLYFCSNHEVEKYSKLMNFPVLYDPCPCSLGAFRRLFKEWLDEFEKKFPGTKSNLINNLLNLKPELERVMKRRKRLNHCKLCGEPSRNEVCKACELINILKKNVGG
jgi:uncharacterized protein (TIGR00269 family)